MHLAGRSPEVDELRQEVGLEKSGSSKTTFVSHITFAVINSDHLKITGNSYQKGEAVKQMLYKNM